ncbi:hypothetical protein SAMN05216312_12214 [Cohnella sp. OV330]|uniref:putative phage tail protein n=1 Tax=Cohnella sp. OV330 TaxID=1855288 RepID=UPI0008F3579D|nr:putative phage tail protein [Cohnella sp. OV330]SFB62544.1 hypothetical protein SAMN05216312_12214 [Cohnella sp. OV330]
MSELASELLARLPPFMRRSGVYQSIFEADGAQLSARTAALADLQLQYAVDTATWGLAYYEAELGIQTDVSKTLADRRALVKSKMRGSGKIDATLLKLVVSSWTGGTVSLSFASGTITVNFQDIIGLPSNMDDVQASLEEIRPAHLAIAIAYRYLTIGEVEAMTLSQLESHPLSEFAPFLN